MKARAEAASQHSADLIHREGMRGALPAEDHDLAVQQFDPLSIKEPQLTQPVVLALAPEPWVALGPPSHG
jgi:hypothetical protein